MHGFDELLRDCRLLFGRQRVIDRDFLESLEMAVLKSAFRRAALVTHPDLFSGQGQAIQKRHAELFIGASNAYRRLTLYLAQKRSVPGASPRPQARDHAPQPPKSRPSPPGSSWPGSGGHQGADPKYAFGARPFAGGRIYDPNCVPAWPLRTGEYLYYSKIVSWKLLISAIVWQRRQRQRIGEIAQRWGWLSEDMILKVVAQRLLGERLGEVLLRHEWLTPFQLNTLLHHQRKSQRPIGRYFVELGLLSAADLERVLEDLAEHNRRCVELRTRFSFNPGFAAAPFRGAWRA